MKRFAAVLLLLALAAWAAEATLAYDPGVRLPAGAEELDMSACPVPRGFWEPLEAKGWVSRCYFASGDPFVLEKALALALERAGYRRGVREEQKLAAADRFVLEQWTAEGRELFVEYFLFTGKNAAVYLIAHPPH